MPAELVDTHCHLTMTDLLNRRQEVIAGAVEAGVTRMISVACVPAEWDAALDLYRAFPDQVRLAAGIHPHEAARTTDEDFARLQRIWRAPGVVACGEMGLDYHYDFSPRERQQTVFERQLDLAADTGLPVIIHCREAHDDVVRLLVRHGLAGRPVVFHCFSGTATEAADLRTHGWRASFTGIITFKNAAALQAVCAATPADELMFETDSPYLSPEPVRRMRPNEPRNLVHTVRFAAQLRAETFESLAATSTAAAVRFFGLAAAG